MAFLDNSGDIILDAVLTDAGRKRLARGDGTFKVSKYAFGDDEVDYGSYNANAASGSAYFDLEILQTPVLEAFTNNRASLKSRLISLTNNNLLFLPQLVLNQKAAHVTGMSPDTKLSSGSFLVVVNQVTVTNLLNATDATDIGDVDGSVIIAAATPIPTTSRFIRIDQGLNTTKLSGDNRLSAELTELQYMIQMDNRLGSITAHRGNALSPSFIDDDQIATYYVTKGVGGLVRDCLVGPLTTQGDVDGVGEGGGKNEVIPGPRGTNINFAFLASNNLKASDYLFDTIGTTNISDGTNTYSVINSTVKVTGVTTGYSLDVPITFVKTTS